LQLALKSKNKIHKAVAADMIVSGLMNRTQKDAGAKVRVGFDELVKSNQELSDQIKALIDIIKMREEKSVDTKEKDPVVYKFTGDHLARLRGVIDELANIIKAVAGDIQETEDQDQVTDEQKTEDQETEDQDNGETVAEGQDEQEVDDDLSDLADAFLEAAEKIFNKEDKPE